MEASGDSSAEEFFLCKRTTGSKVCPVPIHHRLPVASSAWSGFPIYFSQMDSHQADRRGFRDGSPFCSGFPIGASSSPVGTRLCLQSLVCYTFAGQLLPSKSFVPSLTHNHNCMYQQKVPGGASRFATHLPAFLLSGKGI